jgi:hypothetical protein
MKVTPILLAGGALAAAAPRLPAQAPPAGPVFHVRSTFTFTVRAPFAAAFPLFGADRERAWAPGWAPAFLHPDPARDTAGMVFTVAHGHSRAVWVNTAFDPAGGHVQYVYVVPDALATLIDIRVQALDSARTTVTVSYERTALAPEAADHVGALGEEDRTSGPHWAAAIAAYLERR